MPSDLNKILQIAVENIKKRHIIPGRLKTRPLYTKYLLIENIFVQDVVLK